MQGQTLRIKRPSWAAPFYKHYRYKGLYGGRSSAKSHTFADMMVSDMLRDKDLPCVCIREIQRSLEFSAMRLIETKIRHYDLGFYFDIVKTQIRRKRGEGIIIFQGMQDHTSDSIKSLEGFRRAWVEEAQNLSARSFKLLRPTIMRNPGAELWCSWNPENATDPVDQFFRGPNPHPRAICAHVNYDKNPFLTPEALDEIERDRIYNAEDFEHIWLGGYNTKADSQVFAGKWQIDEFEPQSDWDGPYFGADWGFSSDPLALVKVYIHDDCLFVYDEKYGAKVEIDEIPALFANMPGAAQHVIRADSARPETISYVSRKGFNVKAAEKWSGSVEDGIAHMRGYKRIYIHARCRSTAQEFRLYSYKIDKLSGDVKPDIISKHDHAIDAIRYALGPMIKRQKSGDFLVI